MSGVYGVLFAIQTFIFTTRTLNLPIGHCYNEFKYLSNLHCYFFQLLTFISIAIGAKVVSWNNNWVDTFKLF